MQIKNFFKNILLKIIIIIITFATLYLFMLPVLFNNYADLNYLKEIVQEKTNIIPEVDKLEIKTHITPYLTLFSDNIKIKDKENNNIIDAQDLMIQISLWDLLFKQITPKKIIADNIKINIVRDKDGIFNFQKIFSENDNTKLKISYNNSKLLINQYQINAKDEKTSQSFSIEGAPLKFNGEKQIISINTKGILKYENNVSDFDIKTDLNYPINTKELENTVRDTQIHINNLTMGIFLPYLQVLADKNIKETEGIIDYLQIDSDSENNITINTQFKDVVFNKTNWTDKIEIKGENKLNLNINLDSNQIKVNSLDYLAKRINIKSNGIIKLEEEAPELDINAEIKESKAEDIVSILPPNLVPKYKTIEKIKKYRVYGDVEGKLNIKGKIPQPDITGTVKGRNIHILDKSLHKLHKGSVDIIFNKRILNMDIIIDMYNNQKAKINGYVYMFRDGINHVKIKTTKNIDFPLAQKLVVPISKVFNFQLGPIPDMNIKTGKGVIDVYIKGSLDFVNIDGYSLFRNARLTYKGLYSEIYNVNGKLDFKDDVITFKSESANVKNNSLKVDGKVKINSNLNFNLTANKAESKDILEIINKSELLKDVKSGIAVITEANGPVDLFVNITAKIVPVPFGEPPLPPEEAFTDMRVKGNLNLLNNTCFIQGFYTPINNIEGLINFTETVVDLENIKGISSESPININGKIITDLKTKVPDVDITVESNSINLKDTIKFLTQSYLYPSNYPDLSFLYNIASKHDLYFKYKAKSVDFITDKAYAVMNFINDNSDDVLKAESGRVILDKSTLKVENVKTNIFDSIFNINGDVKHVDTLNPIYNLKAEAIQFNLDNINNIDELKILPENIKNKIKRFENYKGEANILFALDNNILKSEISFLNTEFEEPKTKTSVKFDDFDIKLNNNQVIIDNMTALIGDMPIFLDLQLSDINKNPKIKSYFTSKITNGFIKTYLPENISDKINIQGDVSLSSDITGTIGDISIAPKLKLYENSGLTYNGTDIGEINDEREFNGNIDIKENKIIIKKLNYIKYVLSQNNKRYPILFATMNGIMGINKDKKIIPEEITIKTHKNLSAKVLNLIFQSPILKQGTINCDLKYTLDKINQTAKIIGDLNCRNIDIPLFDTIIKHIQINAEKEDIKLNVFGFITDGKININAQTENNITKIPKVKSINIYAEQIDNNKLLEEFYKTRQAINEKSRQNNIELPEMELENGSMEIKKLAIKSMVANNFKSNFSINKEGIFHADNINVEVGDGSVEGQLSYNLNNTNLEGIFELNNVDSNYVAQTLFDGENQIEGKANGKLYILTKGLTNEEKINNLSGFVYFNIFDGRMPKLGSLEYLLRASNIIKNGITGFTINSILEILNLVKTGYFSDINGSCIIENGVAKDIEIFSTGENLSLYIKGDYDIAKTHADMEILGKLSNKISTIFGALGNTSLNTFFKLIPGISLLDFGRKDFIEDVEKIPSFTNGDYEARTFQAIINGNINNKSGYVQSFKWVK